MINPNSAPSKASIGAISPSNSATSAVLSTFKSVLGELQARPLKISSVQKFAGSVQRTLAQQVQSDTYSRV